MRGGGTNKNGKWVTKAKLLRHGDEVRIHGNQFTVRVVERKPRGIVVVHVLEGPAGLGSAFVPADSEVELISRPTEQAPKKEPKRKKGQLDLL